MMRPRDKVRILYLERAGIELPRPTLANWMVAADTLIQPLVNLLRDTPLG